MSSPDPTHATGNLRVEFAEFYGHANDMDARLLDRLIAFEADYLFSVSLRRENRLHVSSKELADQSRTNEVILAQLRKAVRDSVTFSKISCGTQAKMMKWLT